MSHENGSLSIHSENIFPIIKKWLYSDHDIFIRELVSNGCDAILKLKKLVGMGEADIPEDTKYEVQVVLDEENKTIQIIDNGIGMTAEEIKKYINQIAFSGAEDFLEKYKDKMDKDQKNGQNGQGKRA
jgi:molecular chaperone HtpG